MRRLGRFTKAEILEAEARFLDGQSVYKIGREMRRKQRPIKLHLINLGLLDEASLEINYNGSHTIAFNTIFEFAASTAPTFTSTDGKTDILVFRYNGSVYQEVGRTLNLSES